MTIRLHVPIRKSTAAPVPNAVLSVDDRTMSIDERNMPGQLLRLLPAGYAHATTEQWRPFVIAATALGLLK